MFNTASQRGAKYLSFFFFIQETVQKLQKENKNTQKGKGKKIKPKRISSNRYCLFTSHQNSLHLAACMKQFFHSRQHRKHTCYFFFLSYCMAVLKLCLFFSLFCGNSRLKAEKQAIICTLYTQHNSLQPRSHLPPQSASYQNIRT